MICSGEYWECGGEHIGPGNIMHIIFKFYDLWFYPTPRIFKKIQNVTVHQC